MSLRSEYLSGPDEEEIWQLVLGADEMPTACDESVAEREEEHIAGIDYQDKQDAFDEYNAPPPNYPEGWYQLSYAQRGAVQQFIAEILKRVIRTAASVSTIPFLSTSSHVQTLSVNPSHPPN